jgi:hypothetical protein
LQFANDTGDGAIEPCTNKAAQPEPIAAGATQKKKNKTTTTTTTTTTTKLLSQNKAHDPKEKTPSPSPHSHPKTKKQRKNTQKISKPKKFSTPQVRSKIAIVSLSLLSLVFPLGVCCECVMGWDNLWCICVGVLYL